MSDPSDPTASSPQASSARSSALDPPSTVGPSTTLTPSCRQDSSSYLSRKFSAWRMIPTQIPATTEPLTTEPFFSIRIPSGFRVPRRTGNSSEAPGDALLKVIPKELKDVLQRQTREGARQMIASTLSKILPNCESAVIYVDNGASSETAGWMDLATQTVGRMSSVKQMSLIISSNTSYKFLDSHLGSSVTGNRNMPVDISIPFKDPSDVTKFLTDMTESYTRVIDQQVPVSVYVNKGIWPGDPNSYDITIPGFEGILDPGSWSVKNTSKGLWPVTLVFDPLHIGSEGKPTDTISLVRTSSTAG
ncbi:hypothetical protein BCR39DRAFT_556465 [Naematelia encephala]|uniref:Uncharacterized protein n=1 Tax=Naematelia encephala TaxID=71784 RepID=A0A1Y2BJM4_9TREE|nr:hypothetical protein BCR39DRAFT_556465 [Naematelia encephala]